MMELRPHTRQDSRRARSPRACASRRRGWAIALLAAHCAAGLAAPLKAQVPGAVDPAALFGRGSDYSVPDVEAADSTPPPFPMQVAPAAGGPPAYPASAAPSGPIEPRRQPLPEAAHPPRREASREAPGERGWWGDDRSAAPSVRRVDAQASDLSGGVQRLGDVPQAEAAPKLRQVTADAILGQPIAEVRITGNRSIPTWAIERLITETRVGRTVVAEQIRKDKTTLVNTRWFLSVREQVLISDDGPIVVFDVIEAPRLERVEFVGNKKFRTERLMRETGLVPEHGFDQSANLESVQRIKELYAEKGYIHADVRLEKGGSPDDREVRIVIDEGPKVVVSSISFEGNHFVYSPVLRTVLSTKTQWLLLFGGIYKSESIQADVQALRAYYESLGFFDVQVESRESVSKDRSRVHVTFLIQEGQRYHIRNVEVQGNSVLSRDQLLSDLKLKPKDAFNTRFLQADAQAMKDRYDSLGRPFASVQPVPRFLKEPGWLDVVYNIDEDKVCRVGRINIRIRGDQTHTSTLAVRHRINRYLQPGQLAKSKDIQAARTVIATDPLFDREEPPEFNIRRVSGENYAEPALFARGQDDPLPFGTRTNHRPLAPIPPSDFDPSGQQPLWRAPGISGWFGARETKLSPPVEAPGGHRLLQPGGAMPRPALQPQPLPGSSQPQGSSAPALKLPDGEMSYLTPPERARRPQPVVDGNAADSAASLAEALPLDLLFSDASEAAVTADSLTTYRGQSLDRRGLPNPQNYIYQDSNQGDPFGDALRAPNPDYVDVDIDVTEGRTGRLSFGAGINSNAGLVGNIVLQEDNFDITRFPTSWSDVWHGRAFRGGGQSFRLEAIPGTQVSRYTASWRNPYFLGTDFSLGVDGFYYNRYFDNWTEDRLGGRISLGYIINRYWTTGVALRLESVNFHGFLNNVFTPQLYRDVAGYNFLSTAQFRIAHDTRDSAFLPSAGHFIEFSYEQAFGEFLYPRFDLTASQFFTLYQRADGKGKHILQLRGETVWTGDGTPVFERLNAGGFQSFRGFAFRGVSPRENSYRIGGTYMFLGTAEYQFPITASNMIRGVVFSDFGTVDTSTTFDHFRATAGFGFRFTIPAMGPAPLAFDFAWPILAENQDTRQVISFYIGTTF